MMAVELWTQGHQEGSLDAPQWEKLGSQVYGLGKSLGVWEEAEATPCLTLGEPMEACPTESG